MKTFVMILGVIFFSLTSCTDPDVTYVQIVGETEEEVVETTEEEADYVETDENTDTGPEDTGPEDTGPEDTGPEDTGPEVEVARVWSCKSQWTSPVWKICSEYRGIGLTLEIAETMCPAWKILREVPCPREDCYSSCTYPERDDGTQVYRHVFYDVRTDTGCGSQDNAGVREMCDGVEDIGPFPDTDTEEDSGTDTDTGPAEDEVRACRLLWDYPLQNRSCAEYLDTNISTDTIENIVCANGEYSNEPCPEEDAYGYCHIPGVSKTFRYGEGVFDGTVGCEMQGGTWIFLNQ